MGKIINWWRNLEGWKKGGIIGLLFGLEINTIGNLIFIFLIKSTSGPVMQTAAGTYIKYPIINYIINLIIGNIISISEYIFVGMLIGYIVDKTINKNREIKKTGIPLSFILVPLIMILILILLIYGITTIHM